MTELPDPLIPAEVDLQDFPFMPLQVARLRDSDFAATVEPEAAWYGVLLWAASWHQIPAGSLPNNDTMLMRLVGLGRDARTWKKHREEALYGFVLCSDGRLYHPIVAENAKEAWLGKLQQKHRTLCAAVRKHNERKPEEKIESPSFEEWEALGRPDRVTQLVTDLSRVTRRDVARETPSNRQGQGQGQGQGDSNIELPIGSLSKSVPDPDPIPVPPNFELELVGGDAPEPDGPLTPDDILETWNEMAARYGLPIARGMTKARLSQAKARLREFPSKSDWEAAFQCITRTPFLLGENSRGWRADLDFMLQAKSFTKLVEGSYGQA